MYWSGFSIIKWTSSGTSVTLRKEATTGGPMVILGTKWPSMTSTWRTAPPPSMAAWTWSARWAKSAERIDGATWIKAFSEGEIPGNSNTRERLEVAVSLRD